MLIKPIISTGSAARVGDVGDEGVKDIREQHPAQAKADHLVGENEAVTCWEGIDPGPG
mgnify:CR=1 FL=1